MEVRCDYCNNKCDEKDVQFLNYQFFSQNQETRAYTKPHNVHQHFVCPDCKIEIQNLLAKLLD